MKISRKSFIKTAPALAYLPRLLGGKENSDVYQSSSAINYAVDQDRLFKLQQQFIDLRFGMFIHFNIPTYHNADWPDPDASPKTFNPTKLDCEQWARAAQSAGMQYGCLTTKHHSGFCIWPTQTTDYSVSNSPFDGDVVQRYVDAFRKHDLKVCLYYSILDTHHDIRPNWIKPEHTAFIKDQLTELFSNYGEITALIIDGWDAPWSRISYEDIPFSEIYYHVKSMQPNCLISEHNAAKYPREELFYTDFKHYEQNAGQEISRDTNQLPAQAGIPINKRWFWKNYSPEEELKDPKWIVEENLKPLNKAYCNFILNAAPNPEGRIDPNAMAAFKEIGSHWDYPGPSLALPAAHRPIVASNLAKNKKSDSSWSNDMWISDFGNDDNFRYGWQSKPEVDQPWYEIIFDEPTEFNMIAFVESVDQSEESRIGKYELQYFDGSAWQSIGSGKDPKRVQIHRFEEVKAKRVRIFMQNVEKGVGIREFCIYHY